MSLVLGLSGVVAPPAQANATGNVVIGDFEIDGNFYEGFDNSTTSTAPVDPPGDDWGTPAVEGAAAHVVDGIGSGDTTVLGSGHEDRPLSEWSNAAQGNAPGASDIQNVWAYDRVVDGDLYAFFAWNRVATQGQVTWYLELNQRQNTVNGNNVSVPNRSEGDLRVTLRRSGSELSVLAVDRWVGPADTGWESAPATDIEGRVNDSAITLPDGERAAQLFLEFGMNISALFGEESCGFGDFIAMNVRSTAGGATAELKDYLNQPVAIESTCAALTIEKNDEQGRPVGGSTFTVSPNPLPGGTGDGLEIADNDENDADPADGVIRVPTVEPGVEYTVTESGPPPGYLGADAQTVTPSESADETVTFVNSLGSISWQKRDAATGELICCATFRVQGTAGAAAQDPWNVDFEITDNDGSPGANPEDGLLTAANLPTGTYTVTEIVPPAGYELPPGEEASVSGIEITAANPDATITAPFEDPQVLTDLTLRKTDAESGDLLDGAVFQLYRDDGDGVGDEPDEGDEPVGEPCTTGRDGTGLCTVTDLPFGAYYWYEVSPPPGHVAPDDRTSPLIPVTAANAGTEQTFTYANGRSPGTMQVEKLDAVGGEPLGGAVFELFLDDGDGVPSDGDTLVGGCVTLAQTTRLGPGACQVEGLDYGTYIWVEVRAPRGFTLPDPPYSAPVTITAENVDEVQVSTFEDPRELSELTVQKLEAGDGAPLAGATFDLVEDTNANGAYDQGADEVVGSCETAGADGTCSVGSLDFGTYFWVETAPPTGYGPANPQVSGAITINAQIAGTDLPVATFENPRLRSELVVGKVDGSTQQPLENGHFALFLDDDGDGEDGVTDGAPDVDDTLIGTCSTGLPAGTCSVGDLDFGTYYWFETAAPAGYQLPQDRTSPMITVDATNAGGQIEPTTFADPQVASTLAVQKVDESDQETTLAGAEFALYLDDDGDGADGVTGGAPDPDDTQVETCTTAGADGTCSIDDLGFGTYYWFEVTAPPGYGLPTDRTSAMIVVDASDAGGTFPVTTFADPRLLTDLSVLKVDAEGGAPLDGAVFQLYQDDGDGVADGPAGADQPVGDACTTGDDGDGLCTAGDLDFGEYYWYEVDVPPGYEIPDDRTSEIVTIGPANAGEALTVQFSNPRTLSRLDVQKLDASDQAPLAGGEFALYLDTDGDGAGGVTDDGPDPDDTRIATCTTEGTDGTCGLAGLDFGTYYWFEVAAPAGYDLPDDRTSAMVTIDASTAGTELPVTAFADPRLLSALTVQKLDAETTDPLPGGVFRLYRDTDGDGVGAGPDPDDELIDECTTTGDAGSCSIGALDFGDYYWFEAAAPPGYELPADRTGGVITVDATNAGTEIEPFVFEDPQVRSMLVVEKLDAATGAALPGGAFDLVRDDGDGTYEEGVDPVAGSCETAGDDGTCSIGDLTFGTYWWVETAAPPGYELPDAPVSDAIVVDADNAGGELAVTTFRDPQLLTALSVRKLDGEGGEPLAGAVFLLYLDDGDSVADGPEGSDEPVGEPCTTGEDGVCTATGLRFGDYYWYEVAAPPGYEVPASRTSVIVTIDAENAGDDLTVDFSNPRVLTELTVQKVDSEDGQPLAGAGFDLVLDTNDDGGHDEGDTVVGSCDTGDDGTCSVAGLDFGTYFWVEVEPPAGYPMPDDPVSDAIVVDGDNAGAPNTFTFSNPRLFSELSVVKLDAQTDESLAGAEFDLVLDNGDGTYDPGVDQSVGSCTTGEDGTCTIGERDFGTYFWVETAAPQGYELPDARVSDPVVVDASNAGTTMPPSTFRDPQVASTLTVLKLDAENDGVLPGGEFDLVLDDGDGAHEPGTDEVVDSCTTGDEGTCSVDGLLFGTYFWVETAAPDGYLLPEDPVSDPVVVDAGNAGTDFALVTFRDRRATGPTWTVAKDSDPASGTSVQPGDLITYRITASELANGPITDAVVPDDLSEVLPHADVVPGSISTTAGTAVLEGTVLTWTIPGLSGDEVLTYQVQVDEDAAGATIRNRLTVAGSAPCAPDGCPSTVHDVASDSSPPLAVTGGIAWQILLAAAFLVATGALLSRFARSARARAGTKP
ncbi:collagen binding domain-containing protein [Promicromonospora vindobonensis]|uniref:Collagen binding domain-containing protein n=1 Tax=Promicromonospora vindobonensis TaxID=195748 RepID=A0ABW5W1C2_9MICO